MAPEVKVEVTEIWAVRRVAVSSIAWLDLYFTSDM